MAADSCAVPTCGYYAFGRFCTGHWFAWNSTQELRDDQVLGQESLAYRRMQVANALGICW